MGIENEKELAYRYDLFVTPDWRERFDTLIGGNVELPMEGVALDVNCGTGAFAVDLAVMIRDQAGEVIGVDPSEERLELARARAAVLKLDNVEFKSASPLELPFTEERFDVVIGDASMLMPAELEPMLRQMLRVARRGSPVVVKVTTHGSFDEFFSLYWEALHDCDLDRQTWERLEVMINERLTISAAEEIAEAAGLRNLSSVTTKEEFSFENGTEFLESPLIADNFLPQWLSIVPEDAQVLVKERTAETIEHERHDGPFDLSIKATLIFGVK